MNGCMDSPMILETLNDLVFAFDDICHSILVYLVLFFVPFLHSLTCFTGMYSSLQEEYIVKHNNTDTKLTKALIIPTLSQVNRSE